MVEAGNGWLRLRGDATRGEAFEAIIARAVGPVVTAATTQRDPRVVQAYSMHAFGAVFTEVAVDPDLATTRVRRAIVVNPTLLAPAFRLSFNYTVID